MTKENAIVDDQVSILELKRLFYGIKDLKPDICVRVRLIGQMWYSNFTRIANCSEEGIILYDERNNRYILISNLSYVMQFELDSPFQQYRPHFHYTIDATIQE